MTWEDIDNNVQLCSVRLRRLTGSRVRMPVSKITKKHVKKVVEYLRSKQYIKLIFPFL